MDFHSILRRFLFRNPNEIEPDEDLRHKRRNVPENDFSNFEEDMFHEMKDMFESVFRSSFGMIIGFPKLNDHMPCKKSPRSIMLKDDEENPNSDSGFCRENALKDLTHQETGECVRKYNLFSYSKFSSVRTVHFPDGTVEEHRTVIDNDGNKVTTVRRTIGDTSHEITTKSDVQGMKEKEENFLNMDEGELFNFDQKWKELWSEDLEKPSDPALGIPPSNAPAEGKLFNFEEKWKKLREEDPVDSNAPSVGIPSSNPSYWYLIKKYFGSSEGDKIKWC